MSGDGFYDIDPSYNDDVSGLIAQTPSGGFEVPDTSSSPLYAGQAADVVNGDAMFSDFSVSADAILNDIESAPSRFAEADVAGSDSLAKLGMEPLNVAGKPAESSWYQSALNALGLGGSGAAGGKGGGQDVGSLMSTVIVGNILKGLFAAPAQREAAKQNQRLVDSRVANESLQRGALTNQMNGLIGTAGGGATVAPYQPVQRPVYNPFKG